MKSTDARDLGYQKLARSDSTIFLASIADPPLPKVTHYTLKLGVTPKEQRISVIAQLELLNNTAETQLQIPVLLYRLLVVRSVSDENGKAIPFSQNVLALEDQTKLQANVVKIQLRTPLLPGKALRLKIGYEGFIFGYSESMAYVRDTIDEKFSLIRPDTFAYPMVATPTSKSVSASYDTLFTYHLDTTVPVDYTVASGGVLTSTKKGEGTVTFVHKSKTPTRRIDIAIAKFKILADDDRKLLVFTLPEDESGAKDLLNGMKNVIAYYSRMFGSVENYQGYTVIEIPDGWGSQAGDYYALQTAAAFKDPARIGDMYHEVAHTWNARSKPGVQRCRYFDEAFASYFESLATREFQGEMAFLADMEKSRSLFEQWANYDKRNYDTAIADYWKEERGQLSYTKGAWSLYVLHRLVGDAKFQEIVREFVRAYSKQGADFEDFRRTAEKISGRSLTQFFAEWVFGSESSGLLVRKVPIAEIVKRYQ